MPAIMSIDTFLDLVRRSGAIDPRRLDAFVGTRYGGQTPDDPPRVAEDLVAAGLLTRYHIEPLLAGRPQRFVLSGKYRMIDRLGAGGMASVFLCEHKVMRRRVAVKMLPPSVASNPSALDRFHREARAMAGVHHPNIVGAHDVDQDGKIHFIVMEYVEGTNFHELVRRAGPLPVERAAHYISQAALGLQHAHDKGLVHRDIKPANLLLDRQGTVKILDLGLALVFHADDDNLTKDHDANSILGTAEYLAPEQAVDSHGVDHRADIYSLGMTLYFLLAAQTPFGEGTTAQKLIWHQLRQPKPVRDHRPDVPEELGAVISKLLAKDPAERYQTMREVSEALAPWTANPIPLPSENEMPKQLDEVQGDGPMTDGSATLIGYAGANPAPSPPPAFSLLPTPLDAGPSGHSRGPGSNGGVPSQPTSPPVSTGVSFALPGGHGGLEAAIPTPPIAAAPTAPLRASPGSGGPVPSKPVPSRPAPTSNPTRPAVIAAPAPSAAKAVPAASPTTGSLKKATPPSSGSGSTKSVLSSASEDDEEDNARSKPKSKKVKKKGAESGDKNNKGVLIAVGAGGLAAMLFVGGLIWAMSGSDTPAPPTAPAPSPPSPGPKPPASVNPGPKPTVVPQPVNDVFPEPSPGLVNVAIGGTASGKMGPNPKEFPDKAFDGDPKTKWLASFSPSAGESLQYKFPGDASHAVRQYGITVANDLEKRDPKSWELLGSNNWADWDVVDIRNNHRFPTRLKLQVFGIAKPVPYKYYRLKVTANNGADSLQLAELGLYAPRPATGPAPAVETPKTEMKPVTIPTSIEAELGELTGTARVQYDEKANGQKRVAEIGDGGSLTFKVDAPEAGTYKLQIRYSAGEATKATHKVSANGGSEQVVSYEPTGGWSTFATTTVDVQLVSGLNTIRFGGGSGVADIDSIELNKPKEPEPSMPAGPTITADFLPTTPREVHYDLVVNGYKGVTTTAANPWAFIRQTWTFGDPPPPPASPAGTAAAASTVKNLADVKIVVVQTGAGPKADGAALPATVKTAQSGQGVLVGTARVMMSNDVVAVLGPMHDPRPGANGFTQPVLKIGAAKKGESWPPKPSVGAVQQFVLDDFGTYEGQPSVTIKTEYQTARAVYRITYTFVKGIGEVERRVERATKLANGKEGASTLEYTMKIAKP